MVCDFRYCDCVTAHCCGNGSTAEDTSLHVQKEYEAEESKKKVNHLLQYADQMRYGKIVREYLGTDE